MPTEVNVGGKRVILPGVYATIISGVKNPPIASSYGAVCIIDTGQGAGFAGGSGIAGEQANGLNSVYVIDGIDQFRSLCRGGVYWKLAENLFFPAGINASNVRGASRVYFIKAAATTSASVALSLSATTLTIKSKSEGLAANGTLVSGNLSKGIAVRMFQNSLTNKYFFVFYIGNYRGIDPGTNLPYDGIADIAAIPDRILTSDEFTSVAEFLTWANSSGTFASLFTCSALAAGSAAITTLEAAAVASYQVFTGATETYSSTHYDTVLSQIAELDNSFFLAPDSGVDCQSAYNTKLQFHINNDARFEKIMVVGFGSTSGTFKGVSTASVESAAFFNSEKVVGVHGGYQEKTSTSPGLVTRNSFFTAALVLGRLAGLEPQVPITFKTFQNIKGLSHQLTKAERELALKAGITTLINDPELGFCVLQGVNTIQRNSFFVNDDSTSFDISLVRIKYQLNKEIIINLKITFFGKETGFNRNSASPDDIKSYLIGFLMTKYANINDDNLILRAENVQVRAENDIYFASYDFYPNSAVNKIIVTGTLTLDN